MRIAVGVAAAAAFAAVWLLFAPSQLGGGATYSITEGISMQPLLHKNDLAVVRVQSAYKVGDIVLYQSSTLHRPVLHRILVIQNGHYFFKGDNNNFVDPGYAIRSELTGKLWLHLPRLGGVVGWIGKPTHAALFAGLAAAFLLLGGVTAGRRRRRRRGPRTTGPPPGPHQRRYLRPTSKATLTSLAVCAVVGLVATGVGFGTPSTHLVPLQGAYKSTGEFTYRARLIKPSATYPSGFALTGQPIFAKLFKTALSQFKYRFVSKLPHQVHGTIEYKALILSQASGWQKLYTIKPRTSFTGDSAETGGPVAVNDLYTLLNELSAAAGTPGVAYAVDLQPIVHIVGTVGDQPIDSTFTPVLPIAVTPSVVRVDAVPTATLPGATYTPQSLVDSLSAVLKPVQAGSVPQRTANLLTIARYKVEVFDTRVFGVIALGLALLLTISLDLVLRRQSRQPEEEQIAAHLGCLLAPVEALALPVGFARTWMQDFISLARLARYLERPILQLTDETGTTFAVDDDARVYQYHAAPFAPKQPGAERSASRITSPRKTSRRSRVIIVGGVLMSLAIAITLVTSLTATTNVPTSNVGLSSKARQISQLIPAGCSALSLTQLVLGSGDFTITASNALVLGDSTLQTITDNGTRNCIVGGGGKDTVKGDATDICIIGPTSGASYKKCTTSA